MIFSNFNNTLSRISKLRSRLGRSRAVKYDVIVFNFSGYADIPFGAYICVCYVTCAAPLLPCYMLPRHRCLTVCCAACIMCLLIVCRVDHHRTFTVCWLPGISWCARCYILLFDLGRLRVHLTYYCVTLLACAIFFGFHMFAIIILAARWPIHWPSLRAFLFHVTLFQRPYRVPCRVLYY